MNTDDSDRLWVSVLCFLVALAVAGLLSIDDVDGPRRPGTTEVER